jgi:tRNA U34 5-carboxymethylaminomethyl modifying enzyme MnmG/GidA
MKIRNIVLLFILLLIGIIFYKIKEGLTIQEAERELNDLNEQLDNAVREKKFSQVYILQDKVSLAKKAYVKQVQKETKEINNQTPIQELNLKDLLELERKKGLESVKNAINNQKIEDKNKYDKYIEDNQGFFESLTNKAKQILSDQLNTISQLKKQAIDNNFIINGEHHSQSSKLFDFTNHLSFLILSFNSL